MNSSEKKFIHILNMEIQSKRLYFMPKGGLKYNIVMDLLKALNYGATETSC
jgi:hypothetical protein